VELQHFAAPQMVEISARDEPGQAVAAVGALPSRLRAALSVLHKNIRSVQIEAVESLVSRICWRSLPYVAPRFAGQTRLGSMARPFTYQAASRHAQGDKQRVVVR
jgi:hypothetical protein